MIKVVFYTIDCDHCIELEKKLKNAGILYETVDLRQDITVAQAHHFKEAPMLEVDGNFLNFSEAMRWIAEK